MNPWKREKTKVNNITNKNKDIKYRRDQRT